VKFYELQVEGYHTPLSPDQIADLYRAGRLRNNDPCREVDSPRWKTIDELFPLLKHDSGRWPPFPVKTVASSVLERRDNPVPAASTTALKAGWICFGLGLSISWFFPPGNVFFSVALVTAVVAMCTHQVNRGLALLLSSFLAIGLCAALFFGLVLGTAAITGAAAMQKFDTELKRSQAQQQQSVARLNSAVQQLPQPSFPLPASTPGYVQSNASNGAAPSQFFAQQKAAFAQAQEGQARSAAIRRLEQQRDESNAKEARIAQLQKSIDWYDDMVRQVRSHGGDESVFVKARDQLLTQKWELQR
jgi:Tfp pilus assembly protein PilN